MAKVINSNNTKNIGQDFVYNAKKNGVQFGAWFPTFYNKIEDITNFKILDENHTGQTGAMGKLAGAGVGGLAFGGAGAVVGALVGTGNKMIKIKQLAVEFNNKDWIQIEFEDRWADNFILKMFLEAIQETCGVEQASPFAN